MRFYRGPLITLGLAVLLLVAAVLLDRTAGEGGRDVALLLGVAALYFLLPVAVLWFVVAAVRQTRSRRR
jgi:hypothetical protein